ncbi:glycosyltransferase [Persicitalea sp.]|uniref:glycosyltransferase n=1 Tax=Persicitalea sp. TaxID=3100273 RepID=UPI0035948063
MVPVADTIACLPVAGPDNPYQRLMMEGLNQSPKLRAFNGVPGKFFGIARTLVKFRPKYLHFDWIVSYYFRRWRWLTYLSIPLFCAQVLLARLLGVKLVWTMHNVLPHDAAEVGIHRFCQRFLARRCEWIRVFAHSTIPKAAAELRIPERKFRVVPEGDYTGVYPDLVSRREARERLQLPSSARVLLYVGLIKPYKGILELAKCFGQIQHPNTFLLIAGKVMDEGYGKMIEENLSANIIFMNKFIADNDLQYYFRAADAVVLPFKNIENSGSLIMAMGFARTIIAPRQSVILERLQQQDEWLYDSDDELRQKLEQVVTAALPTLEAAGNRNFAALAKYVWGDFASLFT